VKHKEYVLYVLCFRDTMEMTFHEETVI